MIKCDSYMSHASHLMIVLTCAMKHSAHLYAIKGSVSGHLEFLQQDLVRYIIDTDKL